MDPDGSFVPVPAMGFRPHHAPPAHTDGWNVFGILCNTFTGKRAKSDIKWDISMARAPTAFSKFSVVNLGFAAIIALMVTAFLVGYQGAGIIDEYYQQQRVLDQKTRLVYQMREAIRKRSFSLSHVIGLEDYFDRDEELQRFRKSARDFIIARDQILAFGLSTQERESIDEVTVVIGEAQPFVEHAMEYAVEEGAQGEDIETLLSHAFANQDRVLASLDQLVATQEKLNRDTQKRIEQERAKTNTYILVILFGIILVAVLIAVIVTKREHSLIRALRSAKEEADNASRTKSMFLANMSHELRTPLNAIIGFSDMIKSQVLGPAQPGQYEDYARDIHGSGQHLLSLINEILDMSKIEAGEFTIYVESFALREVIDEALMYLSFQAEERGIALVTEVPEVLPPVRGDMRVTKQILINLLTNAVKFTPDDGRIVVHASPSPNTIMIDVSDNGIGMSAEDTERALQPFVQIEREHQRHHNGTGLGLSLCKKFAELQGGNFSLRSEKDQGTTASFTIPVSQDKSVRKDLRKIHDGPPKGGWLPSMSVGVSQWDDDHKALLEIVETLESSIRQGATHKELGCVCDNLVHYVEDHLRSEERTMKDMNYPDFDRHKSKHDQFRAWLAEQRQQRAQLPDTWDGEAAVAFLQHWWRSHILKVDMAYKEFMEARKPELDQRLADQKKL